MKGFETFLGQLHRLSELFHTPGAIRETSRLAQTMGARIGNLTVTLPREGKYPVHIEREMRRLAPVAVDGRLRGTHTLAETEEYTIFLSVRSSHTGRTSGQREREYAPREAHVWAGNLRPDFHPLYADGTSPCCEGWGCWRCNFSGGY